MTMSAARPRLMIVMGTRPEAIKLAPVARAARADGRMRVCLVCTGQHREMLDPMIEHFELPVAVDLNIDREGTDLTHFTTAALQGLRGVLERQCVDMVVVQGDTTSALCGAMAAFQRRIPVAHVEAGLRTYDRSQPFPEEINRRLIGQLAQLHFAPTAGAADNLRREGVSSDRIWVTGNTAVDALRYTLEQEEPALQDPAGRRQILVTAHRRENHGEPLIGICEALRRLVQAHTDVVVRFPVHLSPRVQQTVRTQLEGAERIVLEEPLGYRDFVQAMRQCHLILSDSGGIQEEAPTLGKPVLVLRDKTERPEAVEAGTARLVGTDPERIFEETSRLLGDGELYARMSGAPNPFGDGRAAGRIVDVLASALG